MSKKQHSSPATSTAYPLRHFFGVLDVFSSCLQLTGFEILFISMTKEKYSRPEDIPELVPQALLLPIEQPDLHVPKAPQHTDATTTPREVGYVFFQGELSLALEREILEIYRQEELEVERIFREGHCNHIGRCIMRAMLDPERFAPIDMAKVYDNELALARFPNMDERYYFEHFVENFGILNTRG
jgi:hypothetical protein